MMTDLEITRLCAKSLRYEIDQEEDDPQEAPAIYVDTFQKQSTNPENGFSYDPLHDYAQAMTLVVEHHLHIDQRPGKQISVQDHQFRQMVCFNAHRGDKLDLLRAICLCVVEIQKAKEKA